MYKGKVQELCHQKRWRLPKYSTMKDGTDHDPRFKSSVSVNGLSFHSSASCRSSKHSQNDAAKLAFLHFTSLLQEGSSTNELFADQVLEEIDEMPRTVDINHPDISDSLISNNAESTAEEESKIVETCHSPEIQSDLGVKKDVQCRYKNLLLNHAKGKHLDSPLYSSIREGPAHAPIFKARVTVDGHTFFESQQFFNNLKQAEHAAAKVALFSFAGDAFQEDDCFFYKNLLHEFSLREGLPMPQYETTKCGAPHMPTFISLVKFAGEVFYGKAGRTKKDAEMKAAKVAYTALMECGQSRGICSISPAAKADAVPNSKHSSDMVITSDLQNLRRISLPPVSPPVNVSEEDSKAELLPEANANAKAEGGTDDFIPSPTTQSMDNLIRNQDTMSGFDVPASTKEDFLSSPPMTELDASAFSISDLGAGVREKEANSYLLCNRVRVYTCIPDIAFPKGIILMPITEDKWVAVSLEFPNEEGN